MFLLSVSSRKQRTAEPSVAYRKKKTVVVLDENENICLFPVCVFFKS